MSANRREYRRFQLNLSAEVSGGGRTFTAATRDLSEGGTCLQSAYSLDEGAMIELALFVVVDGIEDAGTPPLRTTARVQWTAENDEAAPEALHLAGLRFEGITDAQRTWLVGVLKRSS